VPQLSHALGPLDREVVRALGLDRVSTLEFLTPDPSLTTIGRENEVITFHTDPVLTAASIDRCSPRDAAKWRGFLSTMQNIARAAGSIARRPPPSLQERSWADRLRDLAALRRVAALDRSTRQHAARWTTAPLADLLGDWFENDLLKAAVAAHGLFGHFAGPRSPGTGALWLQRLAGDPSPVGAGVTVRGGPGTLTSALVDMIRAAGGDVRPNAQVSRIIVRHGRTAGVTLTTGESIDARVLISAVDPRQTLLDLVDPEELLPPVRERMVRYRARGVTTKINLALSALPEFPALRGDPVALRGRLLIAPSLDYLERAFDAAKYGGHSPAPWLEIAVPSVSDASLAPDAQHVMSIYVHFTPRDRRDETPDEHREDIAATALDVLESVAPGLNASIVAREIITPHDLERDWGLSGGHVFHGEMTLNQAWLARPVLGWARHRTPISGLILSGAGTHPAGGLSGLPGLLAARAAKRAV
jgi:phytoene dehydrogenase-like protein